MVGIGIITNTFSWVLVRGVLSRLTTAFWCVIDRAREICCFFRAFLCFRGSGGVCVFNFPYDLYNRFDRFDRFEDECKAEFRVNKRDLLALAEALQIPPIFKLDQRSIVDGMEGPCMLLRRLAYPCRYSDLIHRFGRPVPVISMATNEVLDYIYDTHEHLITQWNHILLNPQAMEVYAQAIQGKGAALQKCFGFVDGTVRPIARPDQHQRIMYNGHKRVHALKFQSVALPNGLIANLYGPVGKVELA